MLKNQNAFTLIELLVTICVLGVLLSLAVPNFRSQIVNNRSTALAEDLTTRINQARYEAIKGAKRVTICASSNSTSATPTCTGSWIDGYIVFEDGATTDTEATVTVGAVLRAYSKHDSKAVIDVKNDAGPLTFIRFTSVGSLALTDASTSPVVIDAYMSGCKKNNKYLVRVGISGMTSVSRAVCL
jgi:type IV fimbrial biogenesis protein FimT